MRLRNVFASAIGALGIIALTACGGSSAPASSTKPVVIGVSVALSGDFSGDGKAILQGYQMWATDVNKAGGLLGRKVVLKVLDDQSVTTQTTTNYQTLIGVDKVDLVVGPFSSLLTIPAEQVAHRYGYLLLGPAGGAPSVFAPGYADYAEVQPAPVAGNLINFVNYIASLPASERPKTAAYATSDDPFTQPQLAIAQPMLEKLGVKTVYTTVFPDETPDLNPEALAVINSKADIVLLGTTSVPQLQAFIQAFIQQHYNPKAIIATSGPDQGSQFSSAIGVQNTEGIFTAGSWDSTANTYQNKQFVKEYLAKYGGTATDIPADAPEAYSVGQVIQQLVAKTGSLSNAALIKAMHNGTYQTVQGPMRWNSIGEPQGGTFLIQWLGGKPVIVWPTTLQQAQPEYPRPNWP